MSKENRHTEENHIFRYKQFTITQNHAAMRVGTDSDLLGTLSAGGNNILDIGTGTGVLSLMLAQRFPNAQIQAIEIDENAVLDAKDNFVASPFADRIKLEHIAFQDYIKEVKDTMPIYDSVVCNPPYFDKSLECNNLSKTRARHSSSLPFSILIKGAYQLLKPGGFFSVCIPKEVLEDFSAECTIVGFSLQDIYKIKTVPEKEAKRFVLVHRKGRERAPQEYVCCMLNEERQRSTWYLQLMKDFHLDR